MGTHLFRINNAYVLAACLLTVSVYSQSAQHQTPDSLDTPFRNGRWLTGLSGSISSNTNKISATDEKDFTNEFGIELATGKFIKDRWLIGGRISANRSNSAGTVDRTTESLFIGPFATYYLSPNVRGSLFITASPGYVRYRDNSILNNLSPPVEQLSEGSGFGSLLGLGYSYVIHDRIAFDIGFNLNLFWIGLDETLQPAGTTGTNDLSISNLTFSFGFNVLLDDFFFSCG